jgi:hypothetical protein
MTPQPAGLEPAVSICALNAAVSTLRLWAAAKLTARHATLLQAVISVLTAALVAALVAALLPGFRGWLSAVGALLRRLQHLPVASLWPDIA